MSGRKQVQTIGAVMAANVRRMREDRGWRQADLAQQMAPTCGWTANTVAAVENGRRGIGGDEVPFLCHALRVPVTSLYGGPATVAAGDLALPARMVAGWLTQPARSVSAAERAQVEALAAARDDLRRAAAALGVTPERMAALVSGFYGHPLHVERDSRAGDVTGLTERQARSKRGHATRAIVGELREAIELHGQEAVVNGATR